jgi:hypothetical protein
MAAPITFGFSPEPGEPPEPHPAATISAIRTPAIPLHVFMPYPSASEKYSTFFPAFAATPNTVLQPGEKVASICPGLRMVALTTVVTFRENGTKAI